MNYTSLNVPYEEIIKFFNYNSPRNYPMPNTQTVDKKAIVREYFSSEEWDAIDAALCDYADYGEDQAAMSAEIGDKIYRLFKEVK